MEAAKTNQFDNSPLGDRGINKIHPHKFLLWMALGGICMMFAGLTSAYIVRRNQSNWLEFSFPITFWYSTVVIILSSVTMQLSLKYFQAGEINKFKNLVSATTVLGILFMVLQLYSFNSLSHSGVKLLGQGSNPSASFLVVIIGIHMLHVFGGVIGLLIVFFKSFSNRIKNNNSAPLEIAATYWHFVGLLWIYLFIFLNWIK